MSGYRRFFSVMIACLLAAGIGCSDQNSAQINEHIKSARQFMAEKKHRPQL